MNVPTITNIDTAISIYYTHSELGNKEILTLFGRLSPVTIARLKKEVKAKMNEEQVCSYGINRINTEIAFKLWGIDVKRLEANRKKLKELEL